MHERLKTCRGGDDFSIGFDQDCDCWEKDLLNRATRGKFCV